MRRLKAWLITVCVALTNGAPPDEVSQDTSPKVANTFPYEFNTKNELFYTVIESYAGRYTVYKIWSIDDKIIYSCHLEFKDPDTNFLKNGFPLKEVDSNLIYLFKDKIVTLNLENCIIKEMSPGIDINDIKEIFLHDDKYYVIFYGNVCRELYCKAIFDSDGKVLKAASPLLGINTSSDIYIKMSSKGFLLNEFRSNTQIKLHFYFYNDLDNSKLLSSVPHGSWYGLSTEENKLGFCAYDDGSTLENASKKVICKQYDVEGKINTMETEIPIDNENHVDHYLKAFNIDKGLFVIMDEWVVKNDRIHKHTFFMYIDENGKQGKRIDIDATCESYKFNQVFYKNSIGEYCLLYDCFLDDDSDYSRYAKCFKKSELYD